MTKYIIVNPFARKVFALECDDIQEAKRVAEIGDVDHGVLTEGIGYCVYEHALFVPHDKQAFFGCCEHLIAGPAVFYGFDEYGETRDLRLSEFPDIHWYLGVNDVEAAIERNEVLRPMVAVNDVVFWRWPDPHL